MKSTVAFFPRSLNHHDLDDWKPTKTNKFLSGLHKTSLIEKIYMKYCNMCRLCINIKLFFFSSFFFMFSGFSGEQVLRPQWHLLLWGWGFWRLRSWAWWGWDFHEWLFFFLKLVSLSRCSYFKVLLFFLFVFFNYFASAESEEEVEEEPEERPTSPEPLQESPNSSTYYEPHPVRYAELD